MKTKRFLLPGMMAALAFAACTNEEIVTMPNVAPEVDLSDRPLVGQVDLNFGPQGATRLAQGDDAFNQVVWTNGDKIGARIIDRPDNGGYKDQALNYAANDYASSNYEYSKGLTDGVWRTEALLVEGNYMFYAPYNPAQGREALVFNFPYEQKISKIEAGKVNEDAIMNFFKNTQNQTVLVGHTFLYANSNPVVSPFMEHLYAYPQFTLKVTGDEFAAYVTDEHTSKNDTIATNLKIKKIIVKDNHIKNKYQADHTKLISMMKNAVVEHKNANDTYTDTEAVPAGRWQSPLALLRDGKSSDIWVNATGAVGKDVVVSLDNACTVAAGEEIKFHVVLPGLVYENLTVNVVFEGKDGEEYIFVNDEGFEAATMTLAPGKRYPREEYDFSSNYAKGYATKATAGQLATFEFESGEVELYKEPVAPVHILNATQLGEWLAKNVTNNTVTFRENYEFTLEKYANLIGAQSWKNGKPIMAFSDSVIKVVNQYLDKGMVVFESQMIVSENLNPSAERFAFNGGVYQTAGTLTLDGVTLGASQFNGNVTLTNVTKPGASAVGMTFNGDATVNGGGFANLTFNNAKTVKIQGSVTASTVTLANGASEIGALNATTTNINGGTVTVPANFAGDLGAINAKNATLNVQKAITNTIVLGTATDDDNDDAMVYAGDATLNVTATDFSLANVTLNSGAIKLDADATMPTAFTNNWKSGNITNNAELTVTDGVTIPAATQTVDDDKNTLKFINNKTVSGELSVAAGAFVDNNYELQVKVNQGTITTGVDTRTYVSDTVSKGQIDNSSLSYVKAGANQTVSALFEDSYQTLTVEALENKGPGLAYINKLIFKNGLTIDKPFDSDLTDKVTSIEIQGGDVVVKTFASTTINKMDITGDVTFRGTLERDNSGFGFRNGAEINVAADKTLTVAYMTMGTMNKANGLNINGNVLVKDANLYIGVGAAPDFVLELNGTILNDYALATGKPSEDLTVAVAAFRKAVAAGGKVVLFADFGLSSGVEINKDTEIVLNGHTINVSSGDAITVAAGKKLTISGGTVVANGAGAEVIKNLGGDLTINSGTYRAAGTDASAAIACDRGAGVTWNLTINGGTFVSTNFTAVSLQNNRKTTLSNADGLAKINGGTFTGSTSYYDLYMANVIVDIDADECEFTNSKVYLLTKSGDNLYPSMINGKDVNEVSTGVNNGIYTFPAE